MTVTAPRIRHVTLFHDPRFYAAFPSLLSRPGGALLCFRLARDPHWLYPPDHTDRPEEALFDHVDARSTLVAMDLDSGGAPLGPCRPLPVNIEAADQDASLTRLPGGRILLGSFSWYPFSARHEPAVSRYTKTYLGKPGKDGLFFLFWGAFTRFSDDDGTSWSPHNYLPAVPGLPDLIPGRKPYHGGALRGRAAVLPSGRILQATYGMVRPDDATCGIHVFASDDRGESWSFLTTALFDESGERQYFEPCLHATPDGAVIAFLRTGGHDDRLATIRSTDGGASWTQAHIHRLRGHPADICPLGDGRNLLVYGYRHRPYGIRARIIDSDCSNIDTAAEIVIRDDGPGRDIGYPSACLLEDGKILIAYYFHGDDDIRRIEGSILTDLPA